MESSQAVANSAIRADEASEAWGEQSEKPNLPFVGLAILLGRPADSQTQLAEPMKGFSRSATCAENNFGLGLGLWNVMPPISGYSTLSVGQQIG